MSFLCVDNSGCDSRLLCAANNYCHIAGPVKPITAANAKQVDGEHYKKYGDLQPWDVIIAWKMDYLTGTALKYIARWKDKGGIKDLEKAIHFLEKQIEVAKAAEKSNQPN